MTNTAYKAVCWRTGAIDIHDGRAPRGAITMFTFASRRAALVGNRVIEANARHAYDGKTLLVPGVPEAANDDAAMTALLAWCQRIEDRLHMHLPVSAFRSLAAK